MYDTEKIETVPLADAPVPVVSNGRRVVALGGGTGLPVVLKGLKNRLFPASSQGLSEGEHERLTAIVTVTDDGGSSGKLRRDLNILPPGDIRNCLSALSDNRVITNDLFQFRFRKGDGLAGHCIGNLLLAALTSLKGNFVDAVQCCGRIMGIKGQILPLTPTNVTLFARFKDGNVVEGETALAKYRGEIKRVFLHPPYPETLSLAIDAIERADAIIIGPGSLYTSIIPNLLVKGIAAAIKRSKAKKFYICNIMTEPGETDGYTAVDHIKAIFDHTEYGLFQYVILTKKRVSPDTQKRYGEQGYYPVSYDAGEIRDLGLTSAVADLIAEGDKIRHDEEKLGRFLMELI
jgi:uncharacterized cofD-like protein